MHKIKFYNIRKNFIDFEEIQGVFFRNFLEQEITTFSKFKI